MKICPSCKAELDDNARFCLSCMTSLDEKEQIPPSARPNRRWPVVLLSLLLLGTALAFVVFINIPAPDEAVQSAQLPTETVADVSAPVYTQDHASLRTCTLEGVLYTFRPATDTDHPTAIKLENYFVLTRVEGVPPDGIYQVPSFVGDDTTLLVTAIADGAFAGTDARRIDLGYNVRYIWGDAFGGCALTDLYLHTDVQIDQTAFSGCTKELTIHGPEYLENAEGILWSELAVSYGFRWQSELI